MSVVNRSTLKTEFTTGTAATQQKFADMIDSSYNVFEDSILLGPSGSTGKYGLLGPTGGTYIGLYVAPYSAGFTGSSGATGQVVFLNYDMYVFSGVNWIKFGGTSV